MTPDLLAPADTPPRPSWRRIYDACFAPVDASSMAVFRIVFGVMMMVEVIRYFANGWIDRYYVAPSFHFTYYGFDWVRPLPGNGMYLLFFLLGWLALCMTLGLWYRLTAALFFVGFTYVFLLEQARYLNHFYLISLVAFLLAIVPAHRAFSLDDSKAAAAGPPTVPAWTLWILRFQIGVAYFFGGVAKLQPDWLFGREPMRAWLAARTDFPVIGTYFTREWMVWAFAYGGLLLDLAIVPLLLWRRTRLLALALATLFHLLNARLFTIGIFPWLMIGATLIFFPPDWPRRLARRVLRAPLGSTTREVAETARPSRLARRAAIAFLCVYLPLQLAMPLRHHLYPGPVSWTEEGHLFSWRMKLRDKEGEARFIVTDKAGNTATIEPRRFLTRIQADDMVGDPDLLLQFSRYLASLYRERGVEVEVRAVTSVSLNGRCPQPLIDPTVNLAAQRRSLEPASWIAPLERELPTPGEPLDCGDDAARLDEGR
jgi:hypothetical protein